MSDYQLYHADCMNILPELDGIDAVLTDPPYGYGVRLNHRDNLKKVIADNKYGKAHFVRSWESFVGNDTPFDPSPFMRWEKMIIWGYQFFADKVPIGTLLYWQKKTYEEKQRMYSFSDGELAWQRGGNGALYQFDHTWTGFIRASEHGDRLHPTQKPVALMEWCLQRLKLPKGATVLDPYMGSGPVGIACAKMGYKYIGIEIDAHYFDVARRRVSTAYGDIMPTQKDDSVGQMVLFSSE